MKLLKFAICLLLGSVMFVSVMLLLLILIPIITFFTAIFVAAILAMVIAAVIVWKLSSLWPFRREKKIRVRIK